MSVLGNRWAFAILVAAFTGTSRFSGFQRALAASPEASARAGSTSPSGPRCSRYSASQCARGSQSGGTLGPLPQAAA